MEEIKIDRFNIKTLLSFYLEVVWEDRITEESFKKLLEIEKTWKKTKELDFPDKYRKEIFRRFSKFVQSMKSPSGILKELLKENTIRYRLKYAAMNAKTEEDLKIALRLDYRIKCSMLTIGPSRIIAFSGNFTGQIIEDIYDLLERDMEKIKKIILTTFIPGRVYTKTYIINKLGDIYKRGRHRATPKAKDLEKYFVLINTKTTDTLEGAYRIKEIL